VVGKIKTGLLFKRFETEWTTDQDKAFFEFGSVADLLRCQGLSAYQAATRFFFDTGMSKSGRHMAYSFSSMTAALIALNSCLACLIVGYFPFGLLVRRYSLYFPGFRKIVPIQGTR